MVSALPPPPGHPDAVDAAADDYAAVASALASAAERLEQALAEGEGLAIDELNAGAGYMAGAMRSTHERYEDATGALRDYAVDFRAGYRDALDAIAWHAEAVRTAAHAAHQLAEARAAFERELLLTVASTSLDVARAHLHAAQRAVEIANEAVTAAERAYWTAMEAIEGAAIAAAARLASAFETAVHSLWDLATAWAGAVWHALAAVGEWALAFLKEVLETIARIVVTFLVGLAIALAIVAVIAVAVMLAATLALLALVLTAEALLAALTRLAAIGVDGLLETVGVEGQTRLGLVFAIIAVLAPRLATAILCHVAADVAAPTPEVTRLELRDMDPSHVIALGNDNMLSDPSNVASILSWGGDVDALGGSERSVVDVARVTDGDGNTVSWIVTLPSTQDWSPLPTRSDEPAANDFTADLALMFFPQYATQYERAVLDVMSEAGIQPGDSVIVNGWSLGGIMAGHLAERDLGGYSYAGVIAAGAPIDHMSIDAPVLQVKHLRDPVHELDTIMARSNSDTHHEYWDTTFAGSSWVTTKTDLVIGHSNDAYVQTLTTHLSAGGAAEDLTGFFGGALPWAGDGLHGFDPGVTVSHTQYAFVEFGEA